MFSHLVRVWALLVLCCPCLSSATDHIVLTSGEWGSYVSEHLPNYGFASQIISDAFNAAEIEVEYHFYPWNRSLAMAHEGSVDGSVLWSYTPERAKAFYFSDPIIQTHEVFFHRTEKPVKWVKLDELKGLRIGTTLSYNYGQAFHDLVQKRMISVTVAPSDERNLQLLLSGRIDIVPMDLNVGLDLIERTLNPEDRKKISYHPKSVQKDPTDLCIVLSKKDPKNKERIEKFNAMLKTISKPSPESLHSPDPKIMHIPKHQ